MDCRSLGAPSYPNTLCTNGYYGYQPVLKANGGVEAAVEVVQMNGATSDGSQFRARKRERLDGMGNGDAGGAMVGNGVDGFHNGVAAKVSHLQTLFFPSILSCGLRLFSGRFVFSRFSS